MNTRRFVAARLIFYVAFGVIFPAVAADYEAEVYGARSGNDKVDIDRTVKIFLYDIRTQKELTQVTRSTTPMKYRFTMDQQTLTAKGPFRVVACEQRSFLPTWQDLAQHIELRLPEVRKKRGVNVSGILRDGRDGPPLKNAELEFSWRVKEFPCLLTSLQTDNQGSFEIAQVPFDNEYAFGLNEVDRKNWPSAELNDYDYFAELTVDKARTSLTAKVCRIKTGVEANALDCDKPNQCPTGRPCYHFDASQKKDIRWQ